MEYLSYHDDAMLLDPQGGKDRRAAQEQGRSTAVEHVRVGLQAAYIQEKTYQNLRTSVVW